MGVELQVAKQLGAVSRQQKGTFVYQKFLFVIQADAGGLVCNQRAHALYGIAALPRMASAEGCIPRRLDSIHPFGMIPYRLAMDSIRSQERAIPFYKQNEREPCDSHSFCLWRVVARGRAEKHQSIAAFTLSTQVLTFAISSGVTFFINLKGRPPSI